MMLPGEIAARNTDVVDVADGEVAVEEQVERVLAAIREMDLTPHPMPGATRTAIGITGNLSAIDPRSLEVLPGVLELIRVTKPYKLASREMHEADTYVRLPQTVIGPGTLTLIAGHCSVENEDMILRTALRVTIVDVTHAISRHSIIQAAFVIAAQCVDVRQLATIARAVGARFAALAAIAGIAGCATAALVAR